ncbi:MAG: methylenetetrahydrofolate reductase [NAD(P)H] [Candidatus Brocadiae bacterium]|nr:methylenetetrahydrofolate reductase [NAD(P)H] [Candidatus Brocadiia bacterium]
MTIAHLFGTPRPVLSFEVFPPKRDGDVESLYRAFDELAPLRPDYISVTYGAGGSNVGLHHEINARLVRLGITPLAHFTCVGQGREAIRTQLDRLRDAGVRNVLALRGDPPKGTGAFEPHPDGFRHASELIAYIRERYAFCVGAACYPETHLEATSPADDLAHLVRKTRAGADFLVTQMFFDNAAYFAFVRRCREAGITVPIQPGVMPVMTPKFFDREWGVAVPAELKRSLQEAAGADEAAASGLAFAIAQCRDLLAQGAPGLHLYIMNRVRPARAILKSLEGESGRGGESLPSK